MSRLSPAPDRRDPFADGLVGAGTNHQHLRTDHLTLDLGRRAARGGAIAAVSHAGTFLLTIAATAIMARLLTPQDYGLIGMVALLISFLTMFKDLGLSTATIQRADITNDQVTALFWLNVLLSVALVFISVVLAPLIASFYGEPRLNAITVVTSLGFLIGGFAVQHEAILRRQMRFGPLAVIRTTSIALGYLVGIAAARNGFGYWSLVLSQLGGITATTVAVWTTCDWRPGWPRRHAGVAPLVKFGGNLTGFSILNYFARNLDNILIGRFFGSHALGLYSKAYQLMMLPIDQINEPITSVAVPALSRLDGAWGRYRHAYLRMLEKVAIATMPSIAVMMVTADWIVQLALGPQWRETSRIFVVLGITGLFQPAANTTGWLFITQGRTRDMLRAGILVCPITIISIVIGLSWGPLGVAASYAVTRLAVTDPFVFWLVGRRGPVRTSDFYRTLAPSICASLVAIVAGVGVRRMGLVTSPVAGITLVAGVMMSTTVLVLSLMPMGRCALRDIFASASLILRMRGDEKTTDRSTPPRG